MPESSRTHRRAPDRVIVVGTGIAGLSAALAAARGDHVRGIAAADVLLVTKTELLESNTYHAQGGIAAAVSPDDDPALHAKDTLAAGDGLCDPTAVDVLTREGADRVRALLAAGVRFDRGSDGTPLRGLEAAHSRARVLHAGGDATGRIVELDVSAMVRNEPRIEILEHTFLVDLVLRDGAVQGILVKDSRNGTASMIAADRVILATGGAGRLYPYTTNPAVATGDGLAAALRAGTQVADLEFYQFHPTALAVGEHFLVSEAVRGEGAQLLDEAGRRYMADVDPRAELAPRDVVARENYRRIMAQDGRPVFLDATAIARRDVGARMSADELGDFLAHRFPTIDAYVRGLGIDWSRDPVPITPAAHYWMGGIRTDLEGRTSIPGLYASGECARTGVQGANRLASNSLLEGLVFGRRAGLAAAGDEPGRRWKPDSLKGSAADENIREDEEPTTLRLPGSRLFTSELPESELPGFTAKQAEDTATGTTTSIRRRIENVMWSEVGVLRDATGLSDTVGALEKLAARLRSGTRFAASDESVPANRPARSYHPAPTDESASVDGSAPHIGAPSPTKPSSASSITALENRDLALLGFAAATAALAREESRGAHARTDHPSTDPAQARSRAWVLDAGPLR
ncbi:FAD-binding protein [uncultured Bifidobacterium sp.]|uniref:L-aspartate oxidase n=1 Tax=uncultured Bifidobacterium sp. TaxID=165187 RepID=UPI0028DC1C3B|nr:FAD-binding protein [uncultured Bifidobacterium sp.]